MEINWWFDVKIQFNKVLFASNSPKRYEIKVVHKPQQKFKRIKPDESFL